MRAGYCIMYARTQQHMWANVHTSETHRSVRHQIRKMVEAGKLVVGLAKITQWYQRGVDVEGVQAGSNSIIKDAVNQD